ncbi:unnamed protein product [Phytomonas sp. Hart1]|nr:unnamed protein product [Phytomonas sp. Hart1]|eukprot:CCW68140.1 unnamed protein product [Phytomonas sp. isolate Hart1]
MSICPGLSGDLTAVPYRFFLGTLPGLYVEKRILRQLQAVFPWYALRKRIREQNNEFIELDLGGCDPELILRYAHVHYSRRQVHDELIERQLTILETGKLINLSDASLLKCLTDCNALILRRLDYELHQLQKAKRACNVAHRRELNPDDILEPHDHLCMMRVVEEDVCGVSDAEMKACAYLPFGLVERKAQEFIRTLGGDHSDNKEGDYILGKKDQKLLQRLIPADYAKVGCVKKLRPVDVTTYYRFAGERLNRFHPIDQYFKRCLYGHVCRKVATHPPYLRSISMYWARYSGLDAHSSLTTMSPELAEAVCTQQLLFPALKFHSQFLYSSPDLVRQMWRTGNVVPLMKLYPLLGAAAAEDLAAGMVVEAEWARLSPMSESMPLQEGVLHTLREAIEQASDWYISNRDALWKRVQEGVNVICPPLSEKEKELVQVDGYDMRAVASISSSL